MDFSALRAATFGNDPSVIAEPPGCGVIFAGDDVSNHKSAADDRG